MLRVSWLKLEINEVRCYEVQIEENEKGQQAPGVEPRTPLACMSCQCSATEPQQPDNHQPPQSSIYTAQVVLNAGCTTEAFSTTCAVYIEDCEGWWLSGCCGSVAEHWRLKPKVSWVRLPAAAGFFHFPPLAWSHACINEWYRQYVGVSWTRYTACTNGRGRGYHQIFLADKRTSGPEKACQKEVVSCHVDQTP